MQRRKPILLVVLAGATALSAPSAGAASGPQAFTGTIITDAAGGERHTEIVELVPSARDPKVLRVHNAALLRSRVDAVVSAATSDS